MLRAVIYARCSTEEESQKDALANQVREAKECVLQNGWLLVDEYVESRSGTTTRKRVEYNRLYEEMACDKFDLIIIKSQDRLMRNTKDWYLFLDRLVTEQKKLYMYIERKFYSPDEALITGIKAILAEDYSRELSKKINNAHHNRQIHNGAVILTSRTYGYKKLADKTVVLIEEEAKIKKRMYELCAAGYGCRTIANILQKEGIRNRDGKIFSAGNIGRMIRNPLHMGTAIMNRYHYDFDSKRRLKVPEKEQFVYKDKVPAIVSEELWLAANAEIDKRTASKKGKSVGNYDGNSQLSGKLFCGLCGEKYYRSVRRAYKDGTRIYEWKCRRYIEAGREGDAARPEIRKVQLEKTNGCDNVHLREETLYELLEKVVKENYQADREKIIRKMLELLRRVFQEKDIEPDIEREERCREKILKQMDTLLEKLLDGVLSDSMYQRKHAELEKSLEEIKERLGILEKQRARGSVLKERISYIENVLREGRVMEKATVAGMMEEVEKIVIYPTCMELVCGVPKVMRLGNLEEYPKEHIHIEYGNLFNYREKKKEEREMIVDMIRENPKITAKKIAENLGISVSGANYKIKALKKDGRIRYNGGGGKGQWEIL